MRSLLFGLFHERPSWQPTVPAFAAEGRFHAFVTVVLTLFHQRPPSLMNESPVTCSTAAEVHFNAQVLFPQKCIKLNSRGSASYIKPRFDARVPSLNKHKYKAPQDM